MTWNLESTTVRRIESRGRAFLNCFMVVATIPVLVLSSYHIFGWPGPTDGAAARADAEEAEKSLRLTQFREAVSSGSSWAWSRSRELGVITFHEDGKGRLKIDHGQKR